MTTKAHTKNDVYILTRLDRPVKGLVLFAKDKNTADKLTKMVQEHSITKIYHALVCGNVEYEGHIESYLMKNSRLNISKIVNKGTAGSKIAILDYKLIEKRGDVNKVEINLKTGRHHQIRVQFASINAPLWGDVKYNSQFKHKRGVTPALCACKLVFNHPITGEMVDVEIDDNF
ncbi:MAG: RNA pseudouridine synthase [Lachnospirales bacterium]